MTGKQLYEIHVKQQHDKVNVEIQEKWDDLTNEERKAWDATADEARKVFTHGGHAHPNAAGADASNTGNKL